MRDPRTPFGRKGQKRLRRPTRKPKKKTLRVSYVLLATLVATITTSPPSLAQKWTKTDAIAYLYAVAFCVTEEGLASTSETQKDLNKVIAEVKRETGITDEQIKTIKREPNFAKRVANTVDDNGGCASLLKGLQ